MTSLSSGHINIHRNRQKGGLHTCSEMNSECAVRCRLMQEMYQNMMPLLTVTKFIVVGCIICIVHPHGKKPKGRDNTAPSIVNEQ